MIEILNGLAALFSIVGFSAPQNYVLSEDLKLDAITEISNLSMLEVESESINLLFEKPLYDYLGTNRYRLIKFGDHCGVYDVKEGTVVEKFTLEIFEEINCRDVIFYFPNANVIFAYYDSLNHKILDCFNNDLLSFSLLNLPTNEELEYPNDYYLRIPIANDAVKIDNYFYFEEITNAHGQNLDGTCAIISSQILLNYYDNFCDDRLVDEEFDVNFVAKESNSDVSGYHIKYDFTAYYSFHDYLCDYIVNNTGETNPHDGVGVNYQIQMIEKYYQSKNIHYVSNVSEGNWGDLITARQVAIIKNAIDNNRPVIASGSIAGRPHSVVAYAYNNDYVWVHTGWGYVSAVSWNMFNSHIFDFEKYGNAGAIDIFPSGNHFHSDNFYNEEDDEYLCMCGSTLKKQLIMPQDYQFQDAYPAIDTYTVVNLANGFSFETNRLRTGYIQKETINLSPKRSGAGTAYLEYKFHNPIARINVDLSYWSANEQIDLSNFKCKFEYFDRTSVDNPIEVVDLVNDVDLSTDRNHPDNFTFHFCKDNLTRFRFYSTSEAKGDRNKGRLSIGDMVVYYET